jgi:hypothetical protein
MSWTWDFDQDFKGYDEILREWGWIEKPAPPSLASTMAALKSVWNAEVLERQLYAKNYLLDKIEAKPGAVIPIQVGKRPWWRFWE